MDFKQLQSFTTVAKCNSFTKAAELLFTSQSTISTHVHQLEEELHTQLFIRTTREMKMTPAGGELYEYAINILSIQKRMVQLCTQNSQNIIHLGASTIPSAYILPDILPQYQKLHPNTTFNIHQNDSQAILDGLHDGIFDIGLIGMYCKDASLHCIPFCEDHMVLITPATPHFQAYKDNPTLSHKELWATLLKEPFILREPGSGSRKSANLFLNRMGISEDQLTVTARINDQTAIKNLVMGGLGISFISEKAIHDLAEKKRLLTFELSEDIISRQFYIVYRKKQVLKDYVENFVQFIQLLHKTVLQKQRNPYDSNEIKSKELQ